MAATTVVDHYISSDDEESSVDYEDTDDAQGNFVETHDNYLNDLASHLNQLRKAETLCDMTIVVNNRRFPVHKAILCAASSYFSAMFTSGFQESSQSEIEIDGNGEAFERLLNFAYTGVISLNTELIGDIISTASYLQFNKVVPLCSRFLKRAYARKLVPLPDAFTILNMAITHKFPALQKHAETYLAKHFVEFSETSVFLRDASSDYVKSVLYRKDLVRWAREEKIFNGTVAWLKHDWEGRQKYAGQFLKLIRLGLVPIDNLKERMDSDLQAIPECREMVEEVEKCLALKESSKTPLSFQFPDLFASRGTVTRVIVIDPSTPTVACHEERGWQDLGNFAQIPFEEPFGEHQVIVVNQELYLAGGAYRVSVVLDTVMLATLHCNHFYRYDRLRNQWISLPPMRTKRSSFTMVHLDGFIYAVGGKGGLSNRFETKVERFNINAREWEEVESLPVALRTLSSVTYQNVILVYGIRMRHTGGINIGRQATLFAYDPVSKTWTSLVSEFLPVHRELESVEVNPNLPPELVVEEGKCYRIVYYGSKTPKVNQVNVNLALGSATFSEPHNRADQEFIGRNNHRAGAFAINKRVFVNLNGYIHRLNMNLDCTEEMRNGGDEDGKTSVAGEAEIVVKEGKKSSANTCSTKEGMLRERDEEEEAPRKKRKLELSSDTSEEKGESSSMEEVEAVPEPFSALKLRSWEQPFTVESISAVEFTFNKYLVMDR